MTESNLTTPDPAHDLPAPLVAWLETALAGKIIHKERSVSRREGWLVDIERTNGTRLEGFLRLERFDGDKIKRPICQVNHETAVIEALHRRSLPVPGVLAHDEELQATLFERLPGRDDIHELQDLGQQSKIAREFMRRLAQIHSLDVDELNLKTCSVPVSTEDYALSGIDDLERTYRSSAPEPDPLAELTFAWLRRNIPAAPERPALLQGDTGPGNFIYQDDHLSAILDWECAHLGDPMEDLGHLFSRAFFHPWGEMSPLMEVYTQATGRPLDREKLHFYRVASFAKAALGSTAAVNFFKVEGPLPMMIFYSVAGERGLAQSIASALGVDVEDAALPSPPEGLPSPLTLPIATISDHIIDKELSPRLEDAYLRHRAAELRQLAHYQARRERHLSALVEQELKELRGLLEGPVDTLRDGLARVNALIDAWDEARMPDVVRYLTRRAQRAEALALPLAGRFSDPHLSPL